MVEELVEKVMRDVFGSSTADAVIYHLGVKGVSIKDAAQRPDKFMAALYEIFGAGAEVLEKRFVEDIGESLGVSSRGSRLQEIVEKVRSLDRKRARKPRRKIYDKARGERGTG
ncbi:MAG: hypothetical protein HYU39_04045 [Thaumarchaeota archaeon]|nr:hypothetical protein [Nitrososphaerota archaeon]